MDKLVLKIVGSDIYFKICKDFGNYCYNDNIDDKLFLFANIYS